MGDRMRHHGLGSESGSVAGPGGDNLDSIQERARRAAAAGDAAISRCLSGNSEGYLSSGRQKGGQ